MNGATGQVSGPCLHAQSSALNGLTGSTLVCRQLINAVSLVNTVLERIIAGF